MVPPVAMQAATALYYTFSTIAQALAAAMALLAAFALYRLKAIDDECLSSALTMEQDTGGGTTVRVPAIAGNWRAVCTELTRRLEGGQAWGPVRTSVEARVNRLNLLVVAHGRVRRALWLSLVLTAIVIAASIAVLACVPGIVCAHCAGATLFGGVIGTACCLASYVWLVVEAFRRVI
jgi:hypothetical protein